MKPDAPESFQNMLDQAPAMIWRTAGDAKCEYVNATWLAFTGRDFHDELGDGWTESFHAEDRTAVRAACAKRRGFAAEYRLRRHDGIYRRVLLRAAPFHDGTGASAGLIGSCVDVDGSPAVGVEEFFEMSLDNLCVAGFDGYFKRVSPSWSRSLGWTEEELLSRPVLEFVHPDDRAGVLAARQGLEGGVPLLGLVNRYQCKDGSYRWFHWRSVSQVERGVVYAVARDVTEQREAQRVLAELTESLTTTLNSIADGVIATDADAAVTRMNPVAERLTGWTSSEAAGRPLHEIFDIVAGTGGTAAPLVERTIRDGIATGPGVEAQLVARDGTRLPIAGSCAPKRHPDGSVSGAVLVFRDMSAEKQAEQAREQLQRQLIFADRMASVGTLAAGVAHEINNPLAYVTANLEMLVEEIRPEASASPAELSEWADLAGEAREGTERIKKIVRGLKTYSRTDDEHLGAIDVRPVLELSVDMAFNEIKHRARLVKDYGTIPFVDADDSRLSQVFVNLLVNAAQAIPDGNADANEIRIVTSTDPAGRALIEIRDTGPGIPTELMSRIFDPFFTTKPVGVGTGLGLWICHDIVTGMGGELIAGNRPSGGAVFRVVLPPSAGALVEPGPRRASSSEPAARRLSVLVIDDDRAVGVALGRVLKNHDVTLVTSARDALELLLPDAPFDVILSDLMMPDMSGMELYDQLADKLPRAALRMVFLTGGAFTPAASAFLDRVPNERLEKPFDAVAVRKLVGKFAS